MPTAAAGNTRRHNRITVTNRHPSPVTNRHPSPVTRHPSPVTPICRYALLSPLVGRIGNACGNFTTLVGGMLISAASFFLMGPCPWLPAGIFPRSVWLLVLAMAAVGVGSSTLTCAVPCMLDICSRAGYEIEAVSDVIGGLLSFSWSLGALVGPIYGSALVQAFGFPDATSETGVLLFVLTVLGTAVYQAFEPAPAVQRLAELVFTESIFAKGADDDNGPPPAADVSALADASRADVPPALADESERAGANERDTASGCKGTHGPWIAPREVNDGQGRRALPLGPMPASRGASGLHEPLLACAAAGALGDATGDATALARARAQRQQPHADLRVALLSRRPAFESAVS